MLPYATSTAATALRGLPRAIAPARHAGFATSRAALFASATVMGRLARDAVPFGDANLDSDRRSYRFSLITQSRIDSKTDIHDVILNSASLAQASLLKKGNLVLVQGNLSTYQHKLKGAGEAAEPISVTRTQIRALDLT
ncbi:hypothetical protein CXG81DRAFT_24519 [Caulochytrium protostelioides]|uniref:Nucleic acid-binding protein n=1 Tax=Caulochytrium protostelioides TaxID=1555241 RepID=A0A4P9XCC2_9FUNG|nr:hypothetical protein CXG81DRAFT_24519 [Caulochytrium protostelioides]|eukprot:RKP02820.1 hypothetical protein CXG81DRAFT_24519 [Caulochytrium protostelioides]